MTCVLKYRLPGAGQRPLQLLRSSWLRRTWRVSSSWPQNQMSLGLIDGGRLTDEIVYARTHASSNKTNNEKGDRKNRKTDDGHRTGTQTTHEIGGYKISISADILSHWTRYKMHVNRFDMAGTPAQKKKNKKINQRLRSDTPDDILWSDTRDRLPCVSSETHV